MRGAALAGALALLGCVPEHGPLMQPGGDCMRCHGGSGSTNPGSALAEGRDDHSRPWSIAGTVYAAPDADVNAGVLGANVQVTDANGWRFELRSNLAGNFYSAELVAFPLRVCVERGGGAARCMEAPVEDGSCNACHAVPPGGEAPGRVTAP